MGAVPSTNGFLLAAVLAEILTNTLIKGEDHYFAAEMLPHKAIARAREGSTPRM